MQIIFLYWIIYENTSIRVESLWANIFRNSNWVCLLRMQLHMEARNKIIAENIQVSLSNLNNSCYYIKSQIVEEMADKHGF